MAPKESEGGVFITTQKIYDEVVGMRDDFKEAVTLLRETREDVNDHEKRLRLLERWKYALPVTGLAAIAAVFTQVFNIPGK